MPTMYRHLLLGLFLLPSAAALHLPSLSTSHRHHHRMRCQAIMVQATEESICQQLQDGAAPPDLSAVLSTSSGARSFFATYFKGDEWTCADSDAPPSVLMDALKASTTTTLDVILMSIVTGAATNKEPTRSRALSLVSALWDDVPPLQLATSALQDAVAIVSGVQMESAYDQNYEYQVEEWVGILNFSNYDSEQLEKVKEALASFAEASDAKGK